MAAIRSTEVRSAVILTRSWLRNTNIVSHSRRSWASNAALRVRELAGLASAH
jgi:hypothetical protein